MHDLSVLETEQEVKTQYDIPTENLKPCIALMLSQSFPQGPGFGRNSIGYVLATEFRRLGKETEPGFKCLCLWNRGNKPPLREKEIKAIVASAWSTPKTYGCNHPILLNFCIDKKACHYYHRFVTRKRPDWSLSDFYRNGWPQVLTPSQRLLYLALPEAEKDNGTFPGRTVFVTYDRLYRLSGLGKGHIKSYLVSLSNAGLIEVIIGLPFRWHHQATEIRRILPIPHPKRNTGSKVPRGNSQGSQREHIEESQ